MTSSFQRLKELCFKHTPRFEHALDMGCAVPCRLGLGAKGLRGQVGGLSYLLSESFEHVTGVDSSKSFIDACCTLQRRFVPYLFASEPFSAKLPRHARPDRCSFACCDALTWMQKGGRYDLILACNLLCCLRKPSCWLQQLPSSVTPLGVVVLVTPYAWLPAFTSHQDWLGPDATGSSERLSEIMTRPPATSRFHMFS